MTDGKSPAGPVGGMAGGGPVAECQVLAGKGPKPKVGIQVSFATQTYPKIVVPTRTTDQTLPRYMECARLASSATLKSYITPWDTIPAFPVWLSVWPLPH